MLSSIAQDKLAADKPQGNRVDFIGPQRIKRESRALPRSETSIVTGGSKTIIKSGTTNSTSAPGDSSTNTNVVTKLSNVEILASFVTFGAESFVKGPVMLITEGIHKLRLGGFLTLIAITHGNL